MRSPAGSTSDSRWMASFTIRTAQVRLAAGLVIVIIGLVAALATRDSGVTSPVSATTPARDNSSFPVASGSTAPDSGSGAGDDASRTPRSRAGAVVAGARYATLLSRIWPLSPEQAKAVVADAATDRYRDELVASVDAHLVPLQEQAAALGGSTSYRQAVLATRLDSYFAPRGEGRAHARVSVWSLLVTTRVPAPSQEKAEVPNATGTFATIRVDLTWERGAWRLADDATTLEGPTLSVEDAATSAPKLRSDLKGFEDWRPR
jgi:hypothetical protein